STPTVSFVKKNGATVNPIVASSSSASFSLSAPSTAGPASLLVSGISVLIPAAFLDEGVTSSAILTTIAGSNPGITPATVQNGTAVAAAAGPVTTTVATSTAAQGATDRTVVITGANFAPDASVSFIGGTINGVTVTNVSVDSPSQITVTVDVASGA